jgi:hypothetical protein
MKIFVASFMVGVGLAVASAKVVLPPVSLIGPLKGVQQTLPVRPLVTQPPTTSPPPIPFWQEEFNIGWTNSGTWDFSLEGSYPLRWMSTSVITGGVNFWSNQRLGSDFAYTYQPGQSGVSSNQMDERCESAAQIVCPAPESVVLDDYNYTSNTCIFTRGSIPFNPPFTFEARFQNTYKFSGPDYSSGATSIALMSGPPQATLNGTLNPYSNVQLLIWDRYRINGLPTMTITANESQTVDVEMNPSASAWHSIQMVCDASYNCQVYLDGNAVGSPFSISSPPTTIMLGSWELPDAAQLLWTPMTIDLLRVTSSAGSSSGGSSSSSVRLPHIR